MLETDNTIVTASDINYLWGVFLLIASMRRVGMNEPVIVYAKNYTDEAKKVLLQFDKVKIIDAPYSPRSLTCRKGEAMLLADTKYVTWVDCDAFFVTNCSSLITPKNENEIHIRQRTTQEALKAKLSEIDSNGNIVIANFMSKQWQSDIAQRDKARLCTCCSACIMCISTKYKSFLELWQNQMQKVLSDDDVGVVDRTNQAYFQTDESVLNSILNFAYDAPKVSCVYAVNRRDQFVHFATKPKPWVDWTLSEMRSFNDYMNVVDYVLDKNFKLPRKLPFVLKRRNKIFCILKTPLVYLITKYKNLLKRIRLALKQK